MVIITTMDKSTLKKWNKLSNNYQSDINTDLSNISNPNNEWNKVDCCADIRQVSVNVTLIIALIIYFTFFMFQS